MYEMIFKQKNSILTFEQYMKNLCNYTRINSLLFTTDLTSENIADDIDLEQNTLNDTYNDVLIWMHENSGNSFFDYILKNNLYLLTSTILEKNKSLTKEEKVEKLNAVKIYINRVPDFKTYFIREQIATRVFGCDYYRLNFITHRLHTNTDEEILEVRNQIYESVSYDIEFLNLFYIEKDAFYNKEYQKFILDNKFYMSLNYYLQLYPGLFKNEENIKRIKYIMKKSIETMTPSNNISKNIESINLMNKSKKLVSRFEKNIKNFSMSN